MCSKLKDANRAFAVHMLVSGVFCLEIYFADIFKYLLTEVKELVMGYI